jgi:hypothetical protein
MVKDGGDFQLDWLSESSLEPRRYKLGTDVYRETHWYAERWRGLAAK